MEKTYAIACKISDFVMKTTKYEYERLDGATAKFRDGDGQWKPIGYRVDRSLAAMIFNGPNQTDMDVWLQERGIETHAYDLHPDMEEVG
jgi:hypothetical protein